MSKNQYMIMARIIEVYFFPLHLENPMMLIFTKVNKIFPYNLFSIVNVVTQVKFEWHVGMGTLMCWDQ